MHFCGQTEISGQCGGQGIKKSSGCEIFSHYMPLLDNVKFESKTKKLCQFKVSLLPIQKPRLALPLIGSEPDFPTGFS